ncbi:unnamed protein product [Sphenostylis stenocarpa]|uniref:Uncharacterized protein n=1 Tax=Sphenostylis stenocarpa TaxID=92480 RepID=A0AA86SUK2_9FABA|nr:unnamed protein product [Sphenostylis stenocarpa]
MKRSRASKGRQLRRIELNGSCNKLLGIYEPSNWGVENMEDHPKGDVCRRVLRCEKNKERGGVEKQSNKNILKVSDEKEGRKWKGSLYNASLEEMKSDAFLLVHSLNLLTSATATCQHHSTNWDPHAPSFLLQLLFIPTSPPTRPPSLPLSLCFL